MGSSCVKCCCGYCRHSANTSCDEMVFENPSFGVQNNTNQNMESEQTGINDICGLKNSKFIIQAGAYYVELKNLTHNLPKAQPLRNCCKYGDHYLAQYIIYYPRNSVSPPPSSRKKKTFYVIKGSSCIVVESLGVEKGDVSVFNLHPACQGGSHYLADRAGFYIIRSEDNTYLHVRDMSKDGYKQSTASHHKLHDTYANGLHYFATDYYFYIVKRDAEFGLIYHRTKDLGSNDGEPWFHVSDSVVKFLQQTNEAAAIESIPISSPPPPPIFTRSTTHPTLASGLYPQVDQPSLYVTQELFVAKPDSFNLRLIKWKDERGESKEFRLKSSIIHKWREVGDLVRVPWQNLEVWARDKDADERCDAVLSHWLVNPPSEYPATWEGLYKLLKDSQLPVVATELERAVNHARWPVTLV